VRHQTVLAEYFRINSDGTGWVALETSDGAQLPRFRTKRIGKVEHENELYFTIGGTKLGQTHQLNEQIRNAIAEQGLRIIERRSTAGQRPDSVYVGCALRDVSEVQLRNVIERVGDAIRSLT
jgi:hypothetical protein